MKLLVSVLLAVGCLMLVVPAEAHHSFNTFFAMDKKIEIEGVITSFKTVNPHSEMMVEVTEPDGSKVMWRITARGGAVNAKKERWKPEDFIGRKAKVVGNPSRGATKKAMAAGVVTFEDNGDVVCLGGCPGVPEQ
jgi:Family of unknown function (DUF6152)